MKVPDLLPCMPNGVEFARVRLAAAESSLQAAKQEFALAKRKRKEAKRAASRAKKKLRQAKDELADARSVFAQAEQDQQAKVEAAAIRRPKTRVIKRVARRAVRKKATKPADLQEPVLEAAPTSVPQIPLEDTAPTIEPPTERFSVS